MLASARNDERRVASSAAARAACSWASATRSSACRLTCCVFLYRSTKTPDLRPQDLRDDRREDVVDRAEGIALGGVHLVAEGRDEDDRRMRRLPAAADHRGRLEAVHVRHVDVEQDHGEFLLQQVAQRLPTGTRRDEVLAQALEDRLVDQELLGQVVDHQDVDLLVISHWSSVIGHWSSVGRFSRTSRLAGSQYRACYLLGPLRKLMTNDR